MSPLGRKVFLAMIPVNLLLIAWVWIGRIVFGAGGWFFVILLISVVPALLITLLVTTILSFRGSDAPHSLTPSQALAQLVVWGGMLAFGFFIVDFGDVSESETSAFTQLVGRNDDTLALSWTLTSVSALVTVVAWLALLVMLLAQRRRHRSGVPVPA